MTIIIVQSINVALDIIIVARWVILVGFVATAGDMS